MVSTVIFDQNSIRAAFCDGINYDSDMMAIGARIALRQAGWQVPHDIALIGFEDIPAASVIEPALTTVRQPIDRLGSMAVDLLLSVLENSSEEEAPAHRIILPTELVVRASCGSA